MSCCEVTMPLDTSRLLQRLMSEAHISVASSLALSKLESAKMVLLWQLLRRPCIKLNVAYKNKSIALKRLYHPI
jgi:hypothetical protein